MKHKMRKYYHLLSHGKNVKELSSDQWLNILLNQRNWSNTKLVVTVYNNEISLNKGQNHIFLFKSQLDEILYKDEKAK